METPLLRDNKFAIAMSKNFICHSRGKYVALKFHYIRDVVEENQVDMVYCITQDQVAHIITKTLLKDRFIHLRKLMRVQQQGIKG